MQRDEADVTSILTTIENMVNPFDPMLEGESLYKISSGQLAPDSVGSDLLGAKLRGTRALTEFCNKRLISGETLFHDPMKKIKIKTFRHTGQSTITKIRGK